MVLSIFYSKALKDAIATFDQQRDLNRAVIDQLNRFMIVSPIMMTVLLMCIWGKYGFWATSAILFTSGALIYKVVVRWLTLYFILPYSLGVAVEGDILLAEQGWNYNPGASSGLRMIYQFKSQSGKIIKKRHGVIFDAQQKNMPSTDSGKIIIYEFIHNGRSCHAPFVPEYFKKTCLSKRRIQEAINY